MKLEESILLFDAIHFERELVVAVDVGPPRSKQIKERRIVLLK